MAAIVICWILSYHNLIHSLTITIITHPPPPSYHSKQQISSEDKTFSVPLKVAKMSNVISNNIEEEDETELTDTNFNCLKVTSDVLAKVVDYCTHYQSVEKMNEIATPLKGTTVKEIVEQEWYVDFCNVERNMLIDLVAAANYLDIKPLLQLSCLAVSANIIGKTEEEMREIFGIKNPKATS